MMGGKARSREIVEIVAFVKQRGFGRIEIFRRDVFFERTPAERNDAPARVGNRKHHPIAEAIIRHRNIVARDQEAGFHHVLDRNAVRTEMFFQRKAIAGRVAKAELQLRRRRDRAIGKIAARLGAIARGERVGEEFCSELHHIIQRFAALLEPLGIGCCRRQRQPGHRR